MNVSSMTYENKGYMNLSYKIIKLCPDQLGYFFAIRSHQVAPMWTVISITMILIEIIGLQFE